MISFDDVPWIRNRSDAHELPELAVLSALAHPEIAIAEAAIDAIHRLSGDRSQLYLDLVIGALPAVLRRSLESRMLKNYEYQSEFARKYFGDGRERGRVEGLRTAALANARSKLGALSDDQVAAIDALSDQRVLTELVSALCQASGVRRARAALAHALAVASSAVPPTTS